MMIGKVDGIALRYLIEIDDWLYGTDLEEAKIVSYGDVYVVMAALEDIGLVERRMVTSPYEHLGALPRHQFRATVVKRCESGDGSVLPEGK